jgi:hypothetical protein
MSAGASVTEPSAKAHQQPADHVGRPVEFWPRLLLELGWPHGVQEDGSQEEAGGERQLPGLVRRRQQQACLAGQWASIRPF